MTLYWAPCTLRFLPVPPTEETAAAPPPAPAPPPPLPIKMDTNEENLDNLSPDELELLTDNLEDMCKVLCGICNASVKELRSHTRLTHKMSISKYKEIYPQIRYERKSYHRCKICLKIILFNGDKLNKHLNSVHKTSVTWYKQTHLTHLADKQPVTDQLALAVRSAAVFGDNLTPPPLLPRKSHNASPKKKQIYRLPQHPHPLHHQPPPQHHHPHHPQQVVGAAGTEAGGDGKQYFSDNTEEMCVALCQICGAALKYFRSHVKDVHKMTMSDYRISCGSTTYQKETYHRCKICYKVILFESDTIQRHLSKSHKTNLGLYRLEYLNRMQQQQHQPLQMTTSATPLQ